MTTVSITQAKLRCMNLLLRLTENLKSVDFPRSERSVTNQALEEFKMLRDTLFTYLGTDEDYEPHRESVTETLDVLEKAIEDAERFVKAKQEAKKNPKVG